MGEFAIQVVRVGKIEKHPNADTLSITHVHDGYPCIVKTGEFVEGELAVYVPVDALVPVAHPAFRFLDSGKGRTHERIKARRLRGIFSMGLLVKLDVPGAREGDDVQAAYGIEKYVPPAELEPVGPGGHAQTRRARKSETRRFDLTVMVTVAALTVAAGMAAADAWFAIVFGCGLGLLGAAAIVENRKRKQTPDVPVYDIEGIRRHKHVLLDGEDVWITEKIHGCNARFLHTGKRFWVGSRTMFRHDASNVWRKTAEKYDLERKLSAHPGIILFGEVYGSVQDLRYGVPSDEGVRFVAFDAMDAKACRYFDVDEFLAFVRELDVPHVPTLYRGPWSEDLLTLAEGKTTMPGASHVREGIVIKPLHERHAHGLGRVVLKLAGESYLLRKEAA